MTNPIITAEFWPLDPIITAEFWALQKRCDQQLGVVGEASNPRENRVTFRRAMQSAGYVRGTGHTWLKPGFAAVVEPR